MKIINRTRKLQLTYSALLFAGLIALGLLLISTLPVFAQGPTPADDEVNRIAKQLYCPVCQNTPLDVCPTEACRQWREEIRTMLADGKSEAEIKQHFVDYYGAHVLNEPPNRLITYLVPGVAILFGALLLFRGFQLWLKKPQVAAADLPAKEVKPIPQDDYVARLEAELKKRK